MYSTESPILFLIFNRPESTARVFDQIRKSKPRKLYIAADGPRLDRNDEHQLCEKAKEAINIDWDCEVKTLFREINLGCKIAVSEAITWFFQNEEEGIILEDDCLPNENFFRFCDTLLEKYRTDTRVVHIAGTKMNIGKKYGDATYYFSKYTNVWGWASWKRVWDKYDANLKLLIEFKNQGLINNIYENRSIAESLLTAFENTHNNRINTWDYQYAFLNFWNNGLSICPNYNMVSNIGFNQDATHTIYADDLMSNLPYESFEKIVHPQFFVPHLDADYHLLKQNLPSGYKKLINQIKIIIKRIIRYK